MDPGRNPYSGLAGFVSALKAHYEDIHVGLDFKPEPGLADAGDLEHDLQSLLEAAGEAAKAGGTALVLFIAELQYVPEDELAALITSLHRVGHGIGAREDAPVQGLNRSKVLPLNRQAPAACVPSHNTPALSS